VKRLVVDGDVLANGLQLPGIGRVDAAANPDPSWRHLEVEAGAVHSSKCAMREDRRNVRFQRRFVFAEARVAPRPKE
jgi:hypothetical protein